MIEKDILETSKKLMKKFEGINKQSFIKGIKQQTKGSAGLTFEKLIGNENDNFQIADYHGIEIKVKANNRMNGRYTSLFSLVPSNCFGLKLKELRSKYGYPDKDFPDINCINKSVFANIKTATANGFYFNLKIDYLKEKLILLVYDGNDNIVDSELYWDFDEVISAINRKLKYLAFVKYEKKYIEGQKYFKYTKIKFYKFKGVETFFKLLKNGTIRLYICLGVYKSNYKMGKEHDHGIRFDIKECDLNKLYDEYNIID